MTMVNDNDNIILTLLKSITQRLYLKRVPLSIK